MNNRTHTNRNLTLPIALLLPIVIAGRSIRFCPRLLQPALAIAAVVAILHGCKDMGANEAFPAGTFHYTGFDSLGTVIVQGHMSLEYHDSTHVTGDWQLSVVGIPKLIGPQVGTGKLAGSSAGDLLWINLNPQWADDNVFLDGHLTGNRYSGVWQYSGFPGVLNHGTFDSVR